LVILIRKAVSRTVGSQLHKVYVPYFRQVALITCPFSHELLHIFYAEKTILSS